MRAEASTLHLRLLTEAGRLDEALKLAYAEPTGPVTRAVLATALRKAGRAKEAWNLLTQTCPELRGPDAAQCYEVLGRLKE
jgi:predicted Zn-dependent protease